MSNLSTSAKVATPYAEALFESSKSIELIDKTYQDLNMVLTTIEQNNPLESFLFNPLIAIGAKKNVLKELFANQVSNHVLKFLFILIERRRMVLLNSIVSCYTNLMNQLDLVTLIEVYTAIPLNEEQKEALKNKLKKITASKKVQLIINIKPELIGGFIIKIGSKVIDMSIYGQLTQISSYLNGVYL